MDLDKLLDKQSKNIEAVRQANLSVNEAYQIVRKRMEESVQTYFGDRDRQKE